MNASTAGGMFESVTDVEPRRMWFGKGGCVERHDDGTHAVFMRGELLGVYPSEDVATRDVFIAVMMDQARREDLARAFGVSVATVGRVVTRFHEGGVRAVADYGRRGGWTVRTPKLLDRLTELFEHGVGPRAAYEAVAKYAGYGTVYSIYAEWRAKQESAARTLPDTSAPPAQRSLSFDSSTADELSGAEDDPLVATVTPGEPSLEEATVPVGDGQACAPEPVSSEAGQASGSAGEEEAASSEVEPTSEPPLESVIPPAGAMVQHVGCWILLGLLEGLGFYELAFEARGKVARWSLRTAIDAVTVALALGQKCIEGARRIATASAEVLLRHADGISATWVRRVLHKFAHVASKKFPEAIAKRLLKRAGEGDDRILLYVDNHLRPYTGKHTIRKGWRMQSKRAVPGTTEFYVHDEEGCPLFRLDTTSHDSLCDWLMPVVDFAKLALGDEVKPLLFFDRGGAYPEAMAELRNAEAEFATYERKPYPELGATEFTESLEIVLASKPRAPIRIAYTEARNKNLRKGRGRVRRIALLTEDGAQVNILAVSKLPAEALIRGLLARWGRQENQLKHEVERWGINHLDGRRVEDYPPDALIPNPERRRIERLLKLSHTAEGEAWRRWGRLKTGDPARSEAKRDVDRAMERQRDLMALRASVPKVAPVKDTPLAGKLRRHKLGYKNVIDTLRIALANVESDLAILLAPRLDKPREAKKLLATLFAAPGMVRLTSRTVKVELMPAANGSERNALAAFLEDVTRMRLSLPGDPDRRRLQWALK